MIEVLIVALLLLFGLGLIITELVFVPGTSVVGFLGLSLDIAGIYLAFQYFGSTVGTVVLALSILVGIISIYYSFNSKIWDKFALKDASDGKADSENYTYLNLDLGDTGMTQTALKPFGKAEFRNELYEVSSLGTFIEAGEKIVIVKIEGKRVFVKKQSLLSNENQNKLDNPS